MPNADSSTYDNVLNTNLKGSFFLSQMVGKYMKENQIKGNILNIASSSSLRPAISAYTLSKWGMRGLTLGLAKSLAPYGITVNGIAPGPTATPMLKSDNNDITNNRIPLGRFVMPEEIANMAVFLVSGFGRSIIGDIVYMTGGAGVVTYEDMSYNF
jgi:3-oxoacyl-[acyl-carrier protein] reductase